MADYTQTYQIKLIDGSTLEYREPNEIPKTATFFRRFKLSGDEEVFNLGTYYNPILVPRRSIISVSTQRATGNENT